MIEADKRRQPDRERQRPTERYRQTKKLRCTYCPSFSEKLASLPLPVIGGVSDVVLVAERQIALDEDPKTGRPRGTGAVELRAKY